MYVCVCVCLSVLASAAFRVCVIASVCVSLYSPIHRPMCPCVSVCALASVSDCTSRATLACRLSTAVELSQ